VASSDLALIARTELAPMLRALPGDVPPELVEAVLSLMGESLAENTRKGYQSSWKVFERFCAAHRFPTDPINPWYVALFIAAESETHKPQSIARHLAALQHVNYLQGSHESLMTRGVIRTLDGAVRRYGVPPKRKKAVQLDLLQELLRLADAQPNKRVGTRDAGLWTCMWPGAMRRSDAWRLDVGDVSFRDEGVVFFLKRSKTDPYGHGQRIALGRTDHPLTCPDRRMRDLIGIMPEKGPLFRGFTRTLDFRADRMSLPGISMVFKRYIKALVENPGDYGTHSMRRGMVTHAKIVERLSDVLVQVITLHSSSESVSDYVEFEYTQGFGVARQLGL
jgi:integrase